MNTQEQTAVQIQVPQTAFNLKQSIEQVINPEIVINNDEFNNDSLSALIFQKYTLRGATLITGLTGNYTDGNLTAKPNRLTAYIDIVLEETTNELLIFLIIDELNRNIKIKFSNELSADNLSNVTLYQWGTMNLVVDPFTLKEENKIRLIINLYIDVLVK